MGLSQSSALPDAHPRPCSPPALLRGLQPLRVPDPRAPPAATMRLTCPLEVHGHPQLNLLRNRTATSQWNQLPPGSLQPPRPKPSRASFPPSPVQHGRHPGPDPRHASHPRLPPPPVSCRAALAGELGSRCILSVSPRKTPGPPRLGPDLASGALPSRPGHCHGNRQGDPQ